MFLKDLSKRLLTLPYRVWGRCKRILKKGMSVIYYRMLRPLINLLGTKHITWDARELFFQENAPVFNRYDIIVRYLAIGEYYGKNNTGFAIYHYESQGTASL